MELRHKTADLLQGKDHPLAHSLHQESSMLVEDIEMSRQPRAIEERIDSIQGRLAQARTLGDEVLGYGHTTDLHGRFEKLRDGIRQLPRY
jgi:hypothetical protein